LGYGDDVAAAILFLLAESIFGNRIRLVFIFM